MYTTLTEKGTLSYYTFIFRWIRTGIKQTRVTLLIFANLVFVCNEGQWEWLECSVLPNVVQVFILQSERKVIAYNTYIFFPLYEEKIYHFRDSKIT